MYYLGSEKPLRLAHGKFVLFNLTGGHGGPLYGNTHCRVGHRADRQCVNRPMVNGLCGQNKFTLRLAMFYGIGETFNLAIRILFMSSSNLNDEQLSRAGWIRESMALSKIFSNQDTKPLINRWCALKKRMIPFLAKRNGGKNPS
jgi:hypothetical protein